MYCINCGAKLNDDDKFCGNCGTPVVSGPEDTMRETVTVSEGADGQRSGASQERQPAEADGLDHTRQFQPVRESDPETAAEGGEPPAGRMETESRQAGQPRTESLRDGQPETEGFQGGQPDEAEDKTVPLADLGAEPGSGGQENIPSLEKKIMKNMEDELIFEMPEAMMGGRDRGRTGDRPVQSSGARQPYGGQAVPPYGGPGQGGGEPPVYGDYIGGSGKEPPKKKKKKKALVITLVCVIVALIAALAIIAFILTNPTRRLKAYIADRDWTRVEQLYEDHFAGSGSQDEADEILRQEVDALCAEFENGTMDYSTAKRHLSAIAAFWGDSYADDALERLRELHDSMSAFEDGQEALDQGRYEEAISLFGQVSQEDANYEEAQKKLETAKSEYRDQIFDEADSLEAAGDYDGAVELLEGALEVLPGDPEISERKSQMEKERETYRIQSVLDEAGTYAGRGNYFSALDLIEGALEENPGNTELEEAYDRYSRQYQEDILAKAEAALGTENNYDAALIVLDNAINTLNGDYPEIGKVFQAKREEYVQAQLAQSQQANDAAAMAGVWQGTQVISGGISMSAQDFLNYSGMSSERLYMEFYSDGRLYVDLVGSEGEGTWQKDSAGGNTYTLTIQGDGQQVTLEADGTLRMILGDVTLVFAKAPTA